MVDKRFENDIANCLKVLNEGRIILYPTDTVWGLGCDALNKTAVEKIFDLKLRNIDKSMIVLLSDAEDIQKYVTNPPDIGIINSFYTPTTIIFNNAKGFAKNVINKDGSIALRVTKEIFSNTLIKLFKKPIISTSANFSGEKTPMCFSEISDYIIKNVDYTVSYRQVENIPAKPSKIVKIEPDGTIKVIRE